MKISVPSHYRAYFTRPRKRISESLILRTDVLVDLKEVHPSDARVIHVIGQDADNDLSRSRFRVPFEKIDGKPVEVRSYDDKLYSYIGTVDQFLENISFKGALNPFTGWYKGGTVAGLHKVDGLSHSARTPEEYEKQTGIEIRKWDVHLTETQEAIARRAEMMIIVDGHVFDEVPEPVLALTTHDKVELRIWANEKPGAIVERYIPVRDDMLSFGIDEYHRAVEEGRRLAQETGLNFIDRTTIQNVTPWVVRYRGDGRFLHERAKDFVTEARSFVSSMDPLLGMAWRRLADAVDAHHSLTSEVIEASIDICALKKQLDPNLLTGNFTYELDGKLSKSFKSLEEGMRIWQSRDSQCIEWLETGLRAASSVANRSRAWEVTDLVEADKIGRVLGADLAPLVDQAVSGASHLVVVEKEHEVTLACLISNEGQHPYVSDVVTRRGIPANEEHLSLALRHVVENKKLDADLTAEQLTQFGL